MPTSEPKGESSASESAEDEAQDIDELLALAREYRSGSESRPRDLRACFDAYKRAAALGSVEATHAIALFYMSGGVVPQDLKAGAEQLRAAAEAGHVPAKVYLANMYELGILYAKDPEKADVWYRNAARSADIREAPGTPTYERRMAEIGSARDYAAVVESGALDEAAQESLKRRARMHGLDLKISEPAPTAAPAPTRSSDAPPMNAEPPAPANAVPKADARAAPQGARNAAQASALEPAPKGAPKTASKAAPGAKPSAKPSRAMPSSWTVASGLTAFALAALFLVASLALGYGLTLGAAEAGNRVPMLYRPWIVPATFAALGVLPQILWYRVETWVKAIFLGGVFGGVMWLAQRGGAFSNLSHIAAITYAGAAGLALGLFIMGIHGGVRVRKAS